MTKRIALFLCLLLPLALQAQKKTVRTDKFQVTYQADWEPTFEGTYHYYVDEDDNTLWHGKATVNQTKTYKDDVYIYGDYVDTYTDSRTLKVNANYKDGKLDGLFTLNNNFSITFKYNTEYNTKASISLTTNNSNGILNGACKMIADVLTQGTKAKVTSDFMFKEGRVTKFDEVELFEGNKKMECHLTFDDKDAVSGSFVNEEYNIKFKNGYATDRYMDYSGSTYAPGEEERDILQKLADGILSPDSLSDLGYALLTQTIYKVNENFLSVVNDDSFTKYDWWNSGETPFSSFDVEYLLLKEIKLTSYSEFYAVIKDMGIEQLDNLQELLTKGESYQNYYITSQTRSMILRDIPTLRLQAREQLRNATRQRVSDRLAASISGKRFDNLEVSFTDKDLLDAIAFDVYTDYKNGLGYKTTHCVITNLNDYLPSASQVKEAITNGKEIPNGWEDVQSYYARVTNRHSSTESVIANASFDDIKSGYRSYYESHIKNINNNNPTAAKADLEAINEMQDKYLRMVELKRIIAANDGIIINMDIKHCDYIIEAYQFYNRGVSHNFTNPSQISEMQKIIDIQSQFIAALRSDNVKKINKKVKKSDDKRIEVILPLLSSE